MSKEIKTTKITTLTIAEIRQLYLELVGVEGKQTSLLQEKLNLVTKYHLTMLAKKVTEEYEVSEKLRSEIVSKLGKKDENSEEIIISRLLLAENSTEEKPVYVENPAFLEYLTEFNQVLNVQKPIEHHLFKLSDFEKIETTSYFPVFLSLLSVE